MTPSVQGAGILFVLLGLLVLLMRNRSRGEVEANYGKFRGASVVLAVRSRDASAGIRKPVAIAHQHLTARALGSNHS